MKKITIEYIREELAKQKKKLEEFDVKSLMVFGSVARGENDKESDIDFLVEYNSKINLAKFCGLARFLEKIFKRKVDLVRIKALRENLREEIEREAKYAA